MPKLQKSFELLITPEQFLQACSLLELKEVELLVYSHIKRAEHRELRRQYVENHIGNDPLTTALQKKISEGFIKECGDT